MTLAREGGPDTSTMKQTGRALKALQILSLAGRTEKASSLNGGLRREPLPSHPLACPLWTSVFPSVHSGYFIPQTRH